MNRRKFLGFSFGGLASLCVPGCNNSLSFDQEVSRLRKYDQKIKDIHKSGKSIDKINDYDEKIRSVLGLKDSDNYTLIRDGDGEVFGARIIGKQGEIRMYYVDRDKDGKYDRKEFKGIPNQLDILKIFPAPKKKEEKKPGILM